MVNLQAIKAEWRSWSTLIFWGVVALTIFGWIAGSFELFSGIVQAIQGIVSKVGQYGEIDGISMIQEYLDGFNTLMSTFEFLTIASWAVYLFGLYKFRFSQTSTSAENNIRRVNHAAWVGIAAAFFVIVAGWAPWFMAWVFRLISWIFATISYFMFRSAFRDLESESAWSDKAQRGASLLRKSANYNIWLQFMPIIILVIGLIVLMATYQSIINSTTYGSSMGYKEYLGLYVFLGVIIGLVVLVLSILQLVYRIWGWNRIMRGEPVVASEPDCNQQRTVSHNGYCPRCGTPLTPGAKFCQSCGCSIPTAIIGQTTIAEEPIQATDLTSSIHQSENFTEAAQETNETPQIDESSYVAEGYNTDEAPSVWERYKWYFIGGAGVLVAAIILIFSLCGNSDKEIGKKYVYIDTTMFRLTDGPLGEDPIASLDYGQEVSVLDADSLWAKVKVGSKKGYVATSDLMNWEDFNPLDRAMKTDKELFSTAYTRNHRKAISTALKGRYDANLEYLGYYDTFSDGYFQDVTLITKDTSTGTREYVIYGFTEEDGEPIRLHAEIIPQGMADVKDATYRNGKYKITYRRDKSDTQKLEGAEVYSGYIDGKYEIVMNLINYGSHYKGVYYYTNKETLIDIEGESDDNNQLTLTETVNGNITGQFIGEMSWDGYSGYWLSANGEQSLIFKVTKD